MKKIVFMAILYGISCANFLNAEIHTKINSDYIKHCKKGIKGACEMLNDYLIEMDKKCDKNDFKACVLAGLAISINDFKKWKNYNKYDENAYLYKVCESEQGNFACLNIANMYFNEYLFSAKSKKRLLFIYGKKNIIKRVVKKAIAYLVKNLKI